MIIPAHQAKRRATSNKSLSSSRVKECSGSVFPETMIEYPEQDAFCNGNSISTAVRHAVQLGVYCDGGTGAGEYGVFNDFFFDCGYQHNQFDYLFDTYRYTCYESATFPSGSNASLTQTIAPVAISTDMNWVVSDSNKYCSQSERTPVVSPTTAPVTSSPTSAHVTSSPSKVVTIPSPTRMPAIATPAPMISPSSLKAQEEQSSTSNGGPPVGAIVGGAIGAIVVVCIVAFLAIRWNAAQKNTPPVQEEHKDHSATESETGRNVELRLPSTPSTQGDSVSGARTDTASHSSSQRSPTGSTRRSSRPVRFKDQARSVSMEDVPLVAGLAVGGTSQQEILVAQRVDSDVISAVTGSTRRSDPDGRRPDP
jgi:hypothetical protein